MEPSGRVKVYLTQIRIICGAVAGGVVTFAAVVWYLAATGALPSEQIQTPAWLGLFMNGLALAVLVGAEFVPTLFARPGRGAEEESLLAWHRQTTILGFAVREGAGITALVGAMVTGGLTGAMVMVGLVLASMFLAWPREGQLRA